MGRPDQQRWEAVSSVDQVWMNEEVRHLGEQVVNQAPLMTHLEYKTGDEAVK